MAGIATGMPRVHVTEQVEACALLLAGLPIRRAEVEQGGSGRPQQSALMVRRQEAVGPVAGTTLREGELGHDNVARQVLVQAAQAVGCPRPHAWIGTQRAAGVEVEQGIGMVDGLCLATTVHAEFVSHLRGCQVHELVAHVDPGLARLAEPERAANVEGLRR